MSMVGGANARQSQTCICLRAVKELAAAADDSRSLRITPYREVNLIKEGNVAAAASFSGAVIGFTLPLAHAVAQAANLVDMLIWGGIALIVQLVSYMIVRTLIPGIARDIPAGRLAPAVFLGAVAIASGILNAACMAD